MAGASNSSSAMCAAQSPATHRGRSEDAALVAIRPDRSRNAHRPDAIGCFPNAYDRGRGVVGLSVGKMGYVFSDSFPVSE